jgi:hypothetical protein
MTAGPGPEWSNAMGVPSFDITLLILFSFFYLCVERGAPNSTY